MNPILLETLRAVADLRWLKLFEVQYRHPTGGLGTWQFASRKAQPRLEGGPFVSDGVMIVPLLTSAAGNRLVMTREFRVPLGDYEYSFPAGLGDAGEDEAATARRELAEETGLTVTRVCASSPPVASSAGLTDESAVIVFVECTGEPHTRDAEPSENIELLVLDYAQVCELRRAQVKFSSKAWLILLLFEAQGSLNWPAALVGAR